MLFPVISKNRNNCRITLIDRPGSPPVLTRISKELQSLPFWLTLLAAHINFDVVVSQFSY